MSKARIVVAGGGIGGIIAALALLQRGFEVSLYEQAAELHELGAGLQISPNGSRVLLELGLQPAMEAIVSIPITREMRLFDTGQTWHLRGSADDARFGAPFWLVHRGDFHYALAKTLDERAPGALRVGSRCIGFEQDESGATLLLENGERVTGDVLIGADGVHSRTRQALFGEGGATFTGFMAWRAVVPIERLPERLRHGGFVRWVGPFGEVVTYPLRRGELLNFVAVIERDDWLLESWSAAGTVEECRRDVSLWHEDVLATVGAIDIPYKWALVGHPPLAHWSVRRVTLLGDASHPTLPVLGQGANMAIEDGMILARCLEASPDVIEALQRYEVARLNRTSRIVQSSFESASHLRNPLLANPEQAKAFMDRQFRPNALSARYDWLYEYDAISVPI